MAGVVRVDWPSEVVSTATPKPPVVASVTVITWQTILAENVQVIVSVVAICVLRTLHQSDIVQPSLATPLVSVFSHAFVQTLVDPDALSASVEWLVLLPLEVARLSVWTVTKTNLPTVRFADGETATVPALPSEAVTPRAVTDENAITNYLGATRTVSRSSGSPWCTLQIFGPDPHRDRFAVWDHDRLR